MNHPLDLLLKGFSGNRSCEDARALPLDFGTSGSLVLFFFHFSTYGQVWLVLYGEVFGPFSFCVSSYPIGREPFVVQYHRLSGTYIRFLFPVH